MKITGIWSMLFIFPEMVFPERTDIIIGPIAFMHSTPPLDNPTRTLSYTKDASSYRAGWIPPGGGDVTISLSTHVASNRIRLWNCGIEDLKYCLKNINTHQWTSVIEFKSGENHYLTASITQVEMHVKMK
ncbi:hypothetical protein PGT21_036344 [Puccinia graminis f. sp. tritici]|uniref:Uncharacterized protein n=1 Tax=Puccinia graminis f. sp. tritici TaxID=56615 RepID=A0A5B0MJT0_PUCGR|nr:hypothetical protein PGTUg99_037537 [Puccinia graminis f. sp. tritici]KAA1091623.1 hypothetical protein PGT21_036344 [Puccinia graminis f. sp. tritici]